MTTLRTIRADLAALLTAGLSVPAFPAPQTAINPPCAVIQPPIVDNYIVPVSYAVEQVSVQVIVLVAGGAPNAVQDALDDLLDEVRTAVSGTTSANGLQFVVGNTDPPGVFTVGTSQIAGAAVNVNVERSTC